MRARFTAKEARALKRLWDEGRSLRGCALALGRHPETVRNFLRRRFGIDAADSARRSARAWTAAEEAMLRAAWARGETTSAIGAALDRHPAIVSTKAHAIGLAKRVNGRMGKAPPRRMRPCLGCGRTFGSEGAGNRLCLACKRNLAAVDATEHGFAHTGRRRAA